MASLAAKDIALSLNLPAGADVSSLSAAYPVREHRVLVGDMPTATTLEIVVRLLLPSQPAGSRLSIDGVLCYVSPAGNEWTLPLNKVTVRYEKESRFIPVEGLVRPVMKRVLGQLQAASVLATSRAATRGADAARQQSEVNLAAIRQYAALLGEDKEIADVLDEGEQALREVAASATTFGVVSTGSAKAKAATHAAMRRQRGSKDFDKA
jgi:hypothetical protein